MGERTLTGRFYAKNGVVWREPKEVEEGHITMGFPVCTPHEALGDDGADILAEILNESLDAGIIDGADQ